MAGPSKLKPATKTTLFNPTDPPTKKINSAQPNQQSGTTAEIDKLAQVSKMNKVSSTTVDSNVSHSRIQSKFGMGKKTPGTDSTMANSSQQSTGIKAPAKQSEPLITNQSAASRRTTSYNGNKFQSKFG